MQRIELLAVQPGRFIPQLSLVLGPGGFGVRFIDAHRLENGVPELVGGRFRRVAWKDLGRPFRRCGADDRPGDLVAGNGRAQVGVAALEGRLIGGNAGLIDASQVVGVAGSHGDALGLMRQPVVKHGFHLRRLVIQAVWGQVQHVLALGKVVLPPDLDLGRTARVGSGNDLVGQGELISRDLQIHRAPGPTPTHVSTAKAAYLSSN